jgi:hypothetical protein
MLCQSAFWIMGQRLVTLDRHFQPLAGVIGFETELLQRQA